MTKMIVRRPARAVLALCAAGGLVSCNSSTVQIRDYSYKVAFDIDDEVYRASIDYRCHLEDVSRFSERGEQWHIRGSLGIRLIGSLRDGSRFEALPAEEMGRNAFGWAPCPNSTQSVPSYLFIEDRHDAPRVYKFDSAHTTSAHHKVLIIESAFVLRASGTDRFVPASEQPESPAPSEKYFTITLGIYPRNHFRICEPDVDSIISQRRLPWFVPAKSYPATPRAANGQDFVGKCDPFLGLFTDGAEERPLSPDGVAGAWVPVGFDKAQGWLAASGKPTPWVSYGDGHFEVPMEHVELAFYEPNEDRIIVFLPKFFDLW